MRQKFHNFGCVKFKFKQGPFDSCRSFLWKMQRCKCVLQHLKNINAPLNFSLKRSQCAKKALSERWMRQNVCNIYKKKVENPLTCYILKVIKFQKLIKMPKLHSKNWLIQPINLCIPRLLFGWINDFFFCKIKNLNGCINIGAELETEG
jgi:hypothetical protein